MSKEQFFRNVRRAADLVAPEAIVVGQSRVTQSSGNVERNSRQAELWMTTRAVEGFSDSDFADLEPVARESLRRGVERYESLVSQVPANGPPPAPLQSSALEALESIVAIVRPAILNEWKAAVETLIAEAEGWAAHHDWSTRRDPKDLQDDFLGAYESVQLLIHTTTQGRFLLEPVARFVPGGSGLVDFCRLPSYDSIPVKRVGAGWFLPPDHPGGDQHPWSEEAFVATVRQLVLSA